MAKCDTRDVDATVAQIHSLQEAGCDLVRVAVPDMSAARALGAIRARIGLPLVADIHFDYRLALEAIAQGVDKLRLNPGNLRRPEHVQQVVRAAAARGIPIRVGVNAGSLPRHSRDQGSGVRGQATAVTEAGGKRSAVPDLQPPILDLQAEATAQAMVEAALGHVTLLEELGFHDIVISLKAFDLPTTLRAYRLMHTRSSYPLHIGITEAGPPPGGLVRSAVGLGLLLAEGIGDTLRVSLSADPIQEVIAGREILSALGLRVGGVVIVSCPGCGRCQMDMPSLALGAQQRLAPLDRELRAQGRALRVAVMGCVVNGPGEAREADVGIAAGKGRGALFVRGQVRSTVPADHLLEELVSAAHELASTLSP